MKQLIKIEEWSMFLLAAVLFYMMDIPFKWFWILLLTPDLSAVGYLLNNKIGAICYNIAHHKAVAVGVMLIGWWLQQDYWVAAGLILFGHSSMDRAVGYGLKHFTSFQDTHLGKIGKHRS